MDRKALWAIGSRRRVRCSIEHAVSVTRRPRLSTSTKATEANHRLSWSVAMVGRDAVREQIDVTFLAAVLRLAVCAVDIAGGQRGDDEARRLHLASTPPWR